MRVLITGGCGFLGTQLCKRLLMVEQLTDAEGQRQRIDEIVLMDRVADSSLHGAMWSNMASHHPIPSVRTVHASINDGELIREWMRGSEPLSVFHLASMVSGECEERFDEAWNVNLLGLHGLLQALRQGSRPSKLVFTSSIACFGGELPDRCSDFTKHTPQTTYGMTKAMGEMMVNDFSRKGYVDGRSARLPTVIVRPGKPNAAASSWASGMFREPLRGEACSLPVDWDQPHPMTSYRTVIDSLIALHEVPEDLFGSDRAVGLPARRITPRMAWETLQSYAQEHSLALGPIIATPDDRIQQIVRQWPQDIDGSRGIGLGLPEAPDARQVIDEYMHDFGNAALIAKPPSS